MGPVQPRAPASHGGPSTAPVQPQGPEAVEPCTLVYSLWPADASEQGSGLVAGGSTCTEHEGIWMLACSELSCCKSVD